jgi:hypothetical protein
MRGVVWRALVFYRNGPGVDGRGMTWGFTGVDGYID